MTFSLFDLAFLGSLTGAPALDPDAAAYIAAVEAADTQALEPAVRAAINDFVVGCKADGIWGAIKASCILAGARTLTGALVPLVGAAPTNVGGLFVSGDYNRKTGLKGNQNDKRLNSNRNNNADPQDSQHLAAYMTELGRDRLMGSGSSEGASTLGISRTSFGQVTRSRNSSLASGIGSVGIGFIGKSRSSSSDVVLRDSSGQVTRPLSSQTPENATIEVFRGGTAATEARIAFYSIGESLDLALLDARVTALINAFDAAI